MIAFDKRTGDQTQAELLRVVMENQNILQATAERNDSTHQAIVAKVEKMSHAITQDMTEQEKRVAALEYENGKRLSWFHDCEMDRKDLEARVKIMERGFAVFEEKLKPLHEQRLWFIALAALLLAKMFLDLAK